MAVSVESSTTTTPATLSGNVFAALKEEILNGTLRPGRKLQQTELAERFGISRMPVRDALRELEAEGLVTIQPGRAATVAELDLEEFEEVYRIREVLEELAGRLSAPRLSHANLAALEDLVAMMEQASRRGHLGAWLKLDKEFHNLSYQACRSPRLLRLISGFWNSTHLYRRAYCSLPGRIERAENLHRRLMAALKQRDGELVGRLIVEHVQESMRSILEVQPRHDAWLSGQSSVRSQSIS